MVCETGRVLDLEAGGAVAPLEAYDPTSALLMVDDSPVIFGVDGTVRTYSATSTTMECPLPDENHFIGG